MRLPRVLAILILFATAIASFALAAAGCGGDLPPMTDDMMSGDGGASCTQRGSVAINMVCTTDCDCAMPGMLCTKAPYDRKPMPVCTYTCDPSNPNPNCPMGCNMKGYCKLQ